MFKYHILAMTGMTINVKRQRSYLSLDKFTPRSNPVGGHKGAFVLNSAFLFYFKFYFIFSILAILL